MIHPTMIPYMTMANARHAIEFYQSAFGFEWINQSDNDIDAIEHVELRYKDVLIMFAVEGAFGGKAQAPKTSGTQCPMNLYLHCDDADALYTRAMGAGAISVMEPHDAFWGARVFMVLDMDGYHWMFATQK